MITSSAADPTTFVSRGLLALILHAGCAKQVDGAPGQSPEPAAERTTATEPGAPGVPWSEKSRQQRLEFMGIYVFPKMKALFQGFDDNAFAEFKCQTCHGDDMEAVGFRMPNAVYPLPTANTLTAAREYDPKMTDFMLEQVVPAMAELLEQPTIDPKHGDRGAACFGCHLAEG